MLSRKCSFNWRWSSIMPNNLIDKTFNPKYLIHYAPKMMRLMPITMHIYSRSCKTPIRDFTGVV